MTLTETRADQNKPKKDNKDKKSEPPSILVWVWEKLSLEMESKTLAVLKYYDDGNPITT